MREYITERALKEGEYIAETGSTVRATAKRFNSSKSTVHKDVTVILKKIDAGLYRKVKEKLEKNLKERHIRGGNATKRKYSALKD
mgnify:CR=1 FL=1